MVPKNHFFFAVEIPQKTKLIMKEHCEKLQKSFFFRNWVFYEDLHITLAFLGYAPSEQLKSTEQKVAERVQNSKSLTLSMDRLGFFGKEEHPRIFFADLQENRGLQTVRQKVFAACEEAGFKLEKRPFRPHITLARKWAEEKPFQSEWLEEWDKLQAQPLTFEAEHIVLYQTHLQQTPKYEAIRRFSLQKNEM